MGELSHQCRCLASPTQELITYILRRQCRRARKKRSRKKESTVEDAWKIPEKNKKNEPSEQLKSMQSLDRERPKNKYTKTALQIAKNGDLEDRKAKEQARAEKANKWTALSSANCSEDNRSRKEQDGRWLRQRAWKGRIQKRERNPTYEKVIILSSKRSKTTMKTKT